MYAFLKKAIDGVLVLVEQMELKCLLTLLIVCMIEGHSRGYVGNCNPGLISN